MGLASARSFFSSKVKLRDGFGGFVTDLLFDDETWTLRSFVVDLVPHEPRKEILVHPGAVHKIESLRSILTINFSKASIEKLQESSEDEPVALHRRRLARKSAKESGLPVRVFLSDEEGNARHWMETNDSGNQHLRSFRELRGYELVGSDKSAGFLEDVIIDTSDWTITKFRSSDSHYNISPQDVMEIDFRLEQIRLDASLAQLAKSVGTKDESPTPNRPHVGSPKE